MKVLPINASPHGDASHGYRLAPHMIDRPREKRRCPNN
jgi:hypothetical protein